MQPFDNARWKVRELKGSNLPRVLGLDVVRLERVLNSIDQHLTALSRSMSRAQAWCDGRKSEITELEQLTQQESVIDALGSEKTALMRLVNSIGDMSDPSLDSFYDLADECLDQIGTAQQAAEACFEAASKLYHEMRSQQQRIRDLWHDLKAASKEVEAAKQGLSTLSD